MLRFAIGVLLSMGSYALFKALVIAGHYFWAFNAVVATTIIIANIIRSKHD